MNPMFKKLLEKKAAEGKMSPLHEEANGNVLQDLMELLGQHAMGKVRDSRAPAPQATKIEMTTAMTEPGSDEENSGSPEESMEAAEATDMDEDTGTGGAEDVAMPQSTDSDRAMTAMQSDTTPSEGEDSMESPQDKIARLEMELSQLKAEQSAKEPQPRPRFM